VKASTQTVTLLFADVCRSIETSRGIVCVKNIRGRGQASLVQSSSASHGLEGSMTSADRERYESAYLPTAQQCPAMPSNAGKAPNDYVQQTMYLEAGAVDKM